MNFLGSLLDYSQSRNLIHVPNHDSVCNLISVDRSGHVSVKLNTDPMKLPKLVDRSNDANPNLFWETVSSVVGVDTSSKNPTQDPGRVRKAEFFWKSNSILLDHLGFHSEAKAVLAAMNVAIRDWKRILAENTATAPSHGGAVPSCLALEIFGTKMFSIPSLQSWWEVVFNDIISDNRSGDVWTHYLSGLPDGCPSVGFSKQAQSHCLLTGVLCQPVRKFSKVKMPGTGTPVPVISFDNPSACFSGRSGADNFPVRPSASVGVSAALTALTARVPCSSGSKYRYDRFSGALPLSDDETLLLWSDPDHDVVVDSIIESMSAYVSNSDLESRLGSLRSSQIRSDAVLHMVVVRGSKGRIACVGHRDSSLSVARDEIVSFSGSMGRSIRDFDTKTRSLPPDVKSDVIMSFLSRSSIARKTSSFLISNLQSPRSVPKNASESKKGQESKKGSSDEDLDALVQVSRLRLLNHFFEPKNRHDMNGDQPVPETLGEYLKSHVLANSEDLYADPAKYLRGHSCAFKIGALAALVTHIHKLSTKSPRSSDMGRFPRHGQLNLSSYHADLIRKVDSHLTKRWVSNEIRSLWEAVTNFPSSEIPTSNEAVIHLSEGRSGMRMYLSAHASGRRPPMQISDPPIETTDNPEIVRATA